MDQLCFFFLNACRFVCKETRCCSGKTATAFFLLFFFSEFSKTTSNSLSSPSNENCLLKTRVLQLRLTLWVVFLYIFLLLGLFRFPYCCRSIDDKKVKSAGDIDRLCSMQQLWPRRLVLLLPSAAASADRTHPPSIWPHTSACQYYEKKSLRNYFVLATAK